VVDRFGEVLSNGQGSGYVTIRPQPLELRQETIGRRPCSNADETEVSTSREYEPTM